MWPFAFVHLILWRQFCADGATSAPVNCFVLLFAITFWIDWFIFILFVRFLLWLFAQKRSSSTQSTLNFVSTKKTSDGAARKSDKPMNASTNSTTSTTRKTSSTTAARFGDNAADGEIASAAKKMRGADQNARNPRSFVHACFVSTSADEHQCVIDNCGTVIKVLFVY